MSIEDSTPMRVFVVSWADNLDDYSLVATVVVAPSSERAIEIAIELEKAEWMSYENPPPLSPDMLEAKEVSLHEEGSVLALYD